MPDFKEIARKRLAEQEKPGAPTDAAAREDERFYRAFRLATRNLIALSVRLAGGERYQLPYVYFRGGMYWSKGEYVQLDFGDIGLVHLWGSRLLELEEQLGEGNIRLLEEFNPERWGEPPEGEPVILRMEVQRVGDKLPEDMEIPPPPGEQH